MRFYFAAVAISLASCTTPGEDVRLEPLRFTPPPAYSAYSSARPYVQKWANFHAYRNASVEVEELVNWSGQRAVPGESMAIHLSEGSRLVNTTAHPQYFELWLQIPSQPELNKPYTLHKASRLRKITRTRGSAPDDLIRYSMLRDGEMTLSGMQGYDVPTLGGRSGRVATLMVQEVTADAVVFRLSGSMPVHHTTGGLRYHVNVDRTYRAIFKPVKRP